MLDEVNYTVELYQNDVTLNITTDSKLGKQTSELHRSMFGFIEIGGNVNPKKNCFWDNVEFFVLANRERFLKECGKELKKKGYKPKQIWRDIVDLLAAATELGIVDTELEILKREYDYWTQTNRIKLCAGFTGDWESDRDRFIELYNVTR